MMKQSEVVDDAAAAAAAATQEELDEDQILQRAIQEASSQKGIWDHVVSAWRGGFCAPDDDHVDDDGDVSADGNGGRTRAVVEQGKDVPLETIIATVVLEEEPEGDDDDDDDDDDEDSACDTPPRVEMHTLPVPSSQPSRCLLWILQALLVSGLVIGVTLFCIIKHMAILQQPTENHQQEPQEAASLSFHFSLHPKGERPLFVIEPVESFNHSTASPFTHIDTSPSYSSLLVVDTILEGMNWDSDQIVDWLETNVPFAFVN